MPAPATHVVLGLGNTLHSDDGIGPQAIERLRSDARVPADVALIEGGTLAWNCLPTSGTVPTCWYWTQWMSGSLPERWFG